MSSSSSSSSVAYAAVQLVLEQTRDNTIQRQREEIERHKMAYEDLRSQVVRYLASDSDMSQGADSDDLFGDSDGDGSVAD